MSTFFNGKKILCTGGAGFIGSHLVERLVEEGHKVLVIDDLSAGKLSNLNHVFKKIRFYERSVCDYLFVDYLASETDVIFHLATQCLIKGLEDPQLIHAVNDVGTYNVCMAAKKHGNKIVYVSSSEVYGFQTEFPIKEMASMKPVSLYGLTKAIGEKYVQFFHKFYKVPAVIIRPFNCFGERQREDAYAGVITSFIKRVSNWLPPIIYGDGTQTRDFSYVSDIVDGTLLLSNLKDGEIVNLGSGEETSILKIAHLIIYLKFKNNLLNSKKRTLSYTQLSPIFEQPRINDLRRLCADITLAKSYGYSPKVSLEEGLKRYVEWHMKEHKDEA